MKDWIMTEQSLGSIIGQNPKVVHGFNSRKFCILLVSLKSIF